MKSTFVVIFLATAFLVLKSANSAPADPPEDEIALDGVDESERPKILQRSLREIADKRRELNEIETLLQAIDDKLEKLKKSSCLVNLPGMDCDYAEVFGIGKDTIVWSSGLSPGKKRRYIRALQYLL